MTKPALWISAICANSPALTQAKAPEVKGVLAPLNGIVRHALAPAAGEHLDQQPDAQQHRAPADTTFGMKLGPMRA